jgi:hypothetical protein
MLRNEVVVDTAEYVFRMHKQFSGERLKWGILVELEFTPLVIPCLDGMCDEISNYKTRGMISLVSLYADIIQSST